MIRMQKSDKFQYLDFSNIILQLPNHSIPFFCYWIFVAILFFHTKLVFKAQNQWELVNNIDSEALKAIVSNKFTCWEKIVNFCSENCIGKLRKYFFLFFILINKDNLYLLLSTFHRVVSKIEFFFSLNWYFIIIWFVILKHGITYHRYKHNKCSISQNIAATWCDTGNGYTSNTHIGVPCCYLYGTLGCQWRNLYFEFWSSSIFIEIHTLCHSIDNRLRRTTTKSLISTSICHTLANCVYE